MSVRVQHAVYEHSRHKGSELLVLLCIADNADDDGRAYPGYAYLAAKSRLSVRQVKNIVTNKLLAGPADGVPELELIERGYRGHSNRYLVSMKSLQGKPALLGVKDERVSVKPSVKRGETTSAPEPSGTIKEEPPRTKEVRPEVARLCQLMADLQNERLEHPGRYKVGQGWLDEMRRLLDIDGRTEKEVELAIRWVHRDEFWGANILSPAKLRKQFDKLKLEAKRRAQHKKRNGRRGMSAAEIRSLREGIERERERVA